jgi:hypothetical protein
LAIPGVGELNCSVVQVVGGILLDKGYDGIVDYVEQNLC